MLEIKNISIQQAFDIHKQIPEFFEADDISYFTDRLKTVHPIILGGNYNGHYAGYIVAYDNIMMVPYTAGWPELYLNTEHIEFSRV